MTQTVVTMQDYFQRAVQGLVQKGQAKYALKAMERHQEFRAQRDALDAAHSAGLISRAEWQRLRPALTNGLNHWSMTVVGRRLGLNKSGLQYVYENPWFYSVTVDRVAIARAMAGDPSVLPSMTIFERRALRRKLQELYRADVARGPQYDDDGVELPFRTAVLERKLRLFGLTGALRIAETRLEAKALDVAA